jgi:phosphotransacetylase
MTGLPGFEELRERADRRASKARIAVTGGDDPTVLEALQIAYARGWVQPIVFGHEEAIRNTAQSTGIALDGFEIHHTLADDAAPAAVAGIRAGRAVSLMKGQISTPSLLKAVLDVEGGLRTDRVICQIVLMEIPRDDRRFLLADTGICVQPGMKHQVDILRSSVQLAQELGLVKPRVALMAASESVKETMPETVRARELSMRNRQGEFGDCVIQGPLSFDLAYASEAGDKKGVAGSVVGAADIMIFPNLLSANLTVKAIMYTAACRFGGILRGASVPVVFMSRADSVETRLNSLALTLAVLDHPDH